MTQRFPSQRPIAENRCAAFVVSPVAPDSETRIAAAGAAGYDGSHGWKRATDQFVLPFATISLMPLGTAMPAGTGLRWHWLRAGERTSRPTIFPRSSSSGVKAPAREQHHLP